MTRRNGLISMLGAMLLAAPAYAGSPHFIKNLSSVSLQGDGSLRCSFKESGLQSGAHESVTCSAIESVTYECVNGGGKNPSASNKHTFQTEGSGSGDFTVDQNGNIVGFVTIPIVTAADLGFTCPSGQTVTFVSVSYTGVLLEDNTSGASLGFGGTFSFSNPNAPPVR